MKIRILSLLALVCACPAYADSNPFLGDYQNQVAMYVGAGVDNGYIVPMPYHPVPFFIAQFQYSQPTTFFRLPARQSLNVAETLGLGKKYGWDWTDFTIPLVLASGDVALFYGEKWYTGLGAGVGLQAQENERLGAKLLFQFKLFYGYHINKDWGIELYAQHFSNANTAEENHSYAFFGLGVIRNF